MMQYQWCSTSLREFELLKPPFFLLLVCIFLYLCTGIQLWYIITQKNLAWEESTRVWT